MLIIGCDYHPSVQQIAVLDQETGEYQELRLEHKNGEAERFYRKLAGQQVRVGVEATGSMRWFERLLGELKLELWVGDPARVRAAAARKPKTDKEDARLLLRLMEENRFPRLWVPTSEQRDARQLVLHRHRLMQTRTRAKNQLQSLASDEGIQKRVWTQAGQAELQKLALSPWGQVRCQDWLELLQENSSGQGRQRLGHITKQGNSLLRGLLVEAAHVAVRYEPEWKRKYLHLAMKKNRSIAAVAIARCLAVRLWWMWKLGLNYEQFKKQNKEPRSHAE